jgi:hypothetical protein
MRWQPSLIKKSPIGLFLIDILSSTAILRWCQFLSSTPMSDDVKNDAEVVVPSEETTEAPAATEQVPAEEVKEEVAAAPVA